MGTLIVKSIKRVEAPKTKVFDVSVEDNHNFFIKPKGSDVNILVHNCHKIPADGYANTLSKFNAMHMFGLTGTPDRKDGKYPVTDRLIGPVTYQVKVKTMTPRVHLHKTGIAKKTYQMWTRAMQHLANHEERNEMIVKQAIKDMKAGHSVIIPVTFQKHADHLVEMINKRWKGKEEQIALSFTGRIPKHKRKDVLDSLRDGTFRCTVAMRSMLTGVNVPLWSAIYTVIPISNVPNYTQEITRVMTPMEGKCEPIIRVYVDETWGLALGCFATCWKSLKKYKLHKKSKDTLAEFFDGLRNKGSRSGDADDQYKPHKSDHGKKKPTKRLKF
ncbi:helicase ATP-binding domain-containing protein [Vibrio phage vB_VcorM_GR11A]|nr:helicase ATP-binding domain-containing protein [Vibrio phage vB_VcorM_GR11A]